MGGFFLSYAVPKRIRWAFNTHCPYGHTTGKLYDEERTYGVIYRYNLRQCFFSTFYNKGKQYVCATDSEIVTSLRDFLQHTFERLFFRKNTFVRRLPSSADKPDHSKFIYIINRGRQKKMRTSCKRKAAKELCKNLANPITSQIQQDSFRLQKDSSRLRNMEQPFNMRPPA